MGKWDKHEKQKKLDDQGNGRLNIVEVDNDEYKKLLDGIKEVKTVGIDWDEVAAEREAIKQSRQPADISEQKIKEIEQVMKDIDQQAEQDGTFTRDHGIELFDRIETILWGLK